ncbi:hypothetical protein AAL_07094 [Moelleriella libera RCEF 2490]|uniref:Uncharacterized protein n=1 Tax=Moelleriella libera RCEF 2490 TaxID=1081109 RepID=A0A167Y514_9HYPO|nr:hypothetical protein AAL_07094 [Moelleriella libera RCEF 2490]
MKATHAVLAAAIAPGLAAALPPVLHPRIVGGQPAVHPELKNSGRVQREFDRENAAKGPGRTGTLNGIPVHGVNFDGVNRPPWVKIDRPDTKVTKDSGNGKGPVRTNDVEGYPKGTTVDGIPVDGVDWSGDPDLGKGVKIQRPKSKVNKQPPVRPPPRPPLRRPDP